MAKDIELGKAFCATELDDFTKKMQKSLSGKKKNISLNLEKVERVDTLALQLLVSIQNSCQAKGGELVLKNVPEQVSSSIDLLGLDILINK